MTGPGPAIQCRGANTSARTRSRVHPAKGPARDQTFGLIGCNPPGSARYACSRGIAPCETMRDLGKGRYHSSGKQRTESFDAGLWRMLGEGDELVKEKLSDLSRMDARSVRTPVILPVTRHSDRLQCFKRCRSTTKAYCLNISRTALRHRRVYRRSVHMPWKTQLKQWI